jgi:uncharacterized RDD family membrane protein YckC
MAPGTAPSILRVVAYWLDSVVITAICVPVFLLLEPDRLTDASYYAPFAIGMGFGVGYFVVLIGGPLKGTLGMLLLGIRVVDEETGESIGYLRSLLRLTVWIIGGWALLIGWLWGLGNERRQTWHDKAAHSVVIRPGAQPAVA